MSEDKEAHDVRGVEHYVKELGKDVDKRLDDLKVQMNVITQKATKTVAERPLLALAATFVVGIAIGIILSKSSDQADHLDGCNCVD
jgi:ElaB/YqjD/DUF883 family membrane-anchored ribosome-binding protein